MENIEEAKKILQALNLPSKQQNDMCALVLLALSGLRHQSDWQSATNNWVRIHDIISFLGIAYEVIYAENSREIIRKEALHHFRNLALVEDNGKATNSPQFSYRLTQEFLELIRSFGHQDWEMNLQKFIHKQPILQQYYLESKERLKIKTSTGLSLSSGPHSELLASIIETFIPSFAPNSTCLYLGDTENKTLIFEQNLLRQIGFDLNVHHKLPDVILFDQGVNRLF